MSGDTIGDHVGYVVLERDHLGSWFETPTTTFDTVGQAVVQLRALQERQAPARPSTFAIGRLELVMISYPDGDYS